MKADGGGKGGWVREEYAVIKINFKIFVLVIIRYIKCKNVFKKQVAILSCNINNYFKCDISGSMQGIGFRCFAFQICILNLSVESK